MAGKQNKLFLYGTLVVAALVVFAIFMVYNNTMSGNKEPELPFYGPRGSNGEPHYVQDFSLLNQDSVLLDMTPYKGKIYVADFFFTTCQGICPIMTEGMLKVYHAYETTPNVMFLSHTVDPDHDTPYILKRYAGNRDINNAKWQFVTGDKKQIYDLARYSYLVDASVGDGGPTDFVHTENFALVDPEGRIRGYYDGTDTVEVNKLIKDISLLMAE
ncbi:MAG TPA: SCO family protein [Chitinophagales bacterium]|nr:SCO family protein [Chitinophagales bacterium]HNM07557.1 SCO family protein [Chitinophagales bacterium]